MGFARAKNGTHQIVWDGEMHSLAKDWTELPDECCADISVHPNIEVSDEQPEPEPEPASAPEREEVPPSLVDKIREAVENLDTEDASVWNQDGSPKIAAVRAADPDLSNISVEDLHAALE